MKKNLSENVIGGIWMILSALSFSLSNLFIKEVGLNLPAVEIVFFRCLFQIVFISPLLIKNGLPFLATKKIKFYFLRLSFGITNIIISYYVITKIPLANAISISFSRPLFMVFLAVILLGEKVGIHRTLATIVGFSGVIILIRPDTNDGFNIASLLAVFAAFCLTITHVYIKKLSSTEHPLAILMWFAITASIICLPFSLYLWVTPSLKEFLWLLLTSILGFIGQYTTVKAFYHGEATLVSALDYSQIVFASILGIIFFNEMPDAYTYAGSTIIVISSLYVLYRENKREN